MALTASEQELLDFALAGLPTWFQDEARALEDLAAIAKMVGAARAQLEDWFGNALIGDAVGPSGDDPDWLAQHARDRGTSRQAGETDAALRARIQSVADAVTRAEVIAAAQAVVDADVGSGTVAMVELRQSRAYFQTLGTDSGVGGEFTAPDVDGYQLFTPDSAFARPPIQSVAWWPITAYKLVTSGAAVGGNIGTFPITALSGDAAQYGNVGGGASVDASVAWSVQRWDAAGRRDGSHAAYLGRGYRMGTDFPTIILILPYGSTAGTAASVLEVLRTKKGAGIRVYVERRLNP